MTRRRATGRGWGTTGDARAVAPVIGVVLAVAIVVVLASVAGAFIVETAGENDKPAPQTSLAVEIDADTDRIGLEHEAGDPLYSDRTRLVWEINGSTYRSTPPDAGTGMKASDTVVFSFNGTTDSTGAWTNYSSPGSHDISQDHVVTITLYDTGSGNRVYTETVAVSEVQADL